MLRWVASGLFALLLTTAAHADPSGTYTVEGTNPGGTGHYQGTVTLVRHGDAYQVEWQIGKNAFTGTGIGTDEFLAVGYDAGGGAPGIAAFARKGEGWEGVWTFFGKSEIGTEKWTPQ